MLLSNIVLPKWTSVLLSFHVRAGGEERVAVCDVAHKTNPALAGVSSSPGRPPHKHLLCASRHGPPGRRSFGAEHGMALGNCSVSQNKCVLKR